MEQAAPPPPPPPGQTPPPPPPPPGAPGAAYTDEYPVRFAVDYPDRDLSRLTTFFRFFTVIPIGFVLAAVSGGTYNLDLGGANDATSTVAAAGGFLFLAPLLMILFRKKYPGWWFTWNVELLRFSNRVGIYVALMDDTYPSTDEHQAVRLEIDYPDVERDLARGMPLVKWFLAIPHYIVLFFLYIGAFFAVVFAWFAILFTGRYPRGLFDFVEGVIRWSNRVHGYAGLLVTDKYPPFRLSH
jgi:Domain of unknown function (DUF4389)